MKKSYQILLLIGIAAAIIAIMYYAHKPDPPPKPTPPEKNKIVTEFEDKATLMADSKVWDKKQYEDLKQELEIYKQKRVITEAEAISLESFLEVAYAKSMSGQCKKWEQSNGDDDISLLFDAMKKKASIPECSIFLNNDISVITDFQTAQTIPARVSSFLKEQFDLNKYNTLISDINRCCMRTEIQHFSSLQTIANSETNRLNLFKDFVTRYDNCKNLWKSNQADPQYISFYKKYCPQTNTEINQYHYYKYDILTIPGFCP